MKQAEFRCKWIRREEIWDCAEGIRNRNWSAGKLPVDVEAIVEFKLKLDIEPEHNLAQQTDMEAYLRSDLTGIVVDHDHYMDEKFASRMRFSFAHELGHFFLHREFYERVAFESADEWKEILLGLPEADYTNFEYQANEFAGRLLVPREALIHEIEKSIETLKRNNMLEYLKGDPYAVLSGITPRLARIFGVSSDVIERRVDREKLWPPDIRETQE
ncbi:MAG: hypothetical protein CO013_01520 [Syntrophobacterales bacterium CG_4_8_14_3_um_filter_58_8]|nr:MAG: hypothetical protein COS57_01880 [Syntrophobacterales bacterium CG03_land_8_20_14_0_80_58_14]PJC75597.1 MAG: hypothetical protein CO013_01520 [Syntrophobacterales bacterium CG_4_8_14_3_um_filter_58_8]